MIEISGDYLEGGGQILRTSLALSVVLNKPFRICNIRAKRPHPGLRPQHYTAFKVMAELCNAEVKGLYMDSLEVEFIPRTFYPQNLDIDIGTAGSIGLLLQTVLLPLAVRTDRKIRLRIKGGTHVPKAIPVDYYRNIIIPILNKIGVEVEITIINQGYYPRGGGEVVVEISPWRDRRKLNLTFRGEVEKIRGVIHASRGLASAGVGERMKRSIEELLDRYNPEIDVGYFHTLSPGCGVVLWAECEHAILGADALGERGKPAEEVAREVVEKLLNTISSQAGCDVYAGDNLIPWLAFCGGEVSVSEISLHTSTNIWVVEQFLGSIFNIRENLIAVNNPVNLI
ncbi:MAG: RNA 3'-phosphate cyclase [Candidatus Omnitrophica bacterium 4484_49]|nr:MAG: RNA 3'-phosphate cyclase [Candidatus Omnitrophica bacterium 4484_49]